MSEAYDAQKRNAMAPDRIAAGYPVALRPGLLRITAPNPSPLTAEGTNSYVIQGEAPILIDPGPDNAAHRETLLHALGGQVPAAILVTHSHLDHSPLATVLAGETGAPLLAFGPTGAGRSAVMNEIAATGDIGGSEGADPNFAPDRALADGETLVLGGEEITALHTPGHFGNHMCFAWHGALFSGDHVMGWASTLVSPPDGDLTHFMASTERLAARKESIHYPGHGAPVSDPAARMAWLLEHRRGRDAQIRQALTAGPSDAAKLTRAVYTDVPPHLWPAAERNVLAHLIALYAEGDARTDGPLSTTSIFSLS
ncbi:MAG: MBL fold metallo-hydrolase [Pseudomonadota bacterium]